MSANVSRTSIGFEGVSSPASAQMKYPSGSTSQMKYPSSSGQLGSSQAISEAQRSFAQPTRAPHARPPQKNKSEQGFFDWVFDAFKPKKSRRSQDEDEDQELQESELQKFRQRIQDYRFSFACTFKLRLGLPSGFENYRGEFLLVGKQ